MILAGDTGGTSTRLAAVDVDGERLRAVVEQTYPSREHAGLGEIVAEFVGAHAVKVTHACFGIAGPVRDGRVVTPNLPWVVDAAELAAQLRIARADLLNDLEANAWGIGALGPDDFLTLNSGAPNAQGNACVVAAGTGLGEAGMYWDGTMHRPFACEGGHGDFAPRDDREVELFRYLAARFEHVSCERVVSGPGLANIYAFLRDTGRGTETPEVAAAMRQGDPAGVIGRAALDGRCRLCVDTLDLCVSLYGAETGNAALKFMAEGGVYLGGGIAPKIAPKLADGTFLRAFLAKGRMRPLLEAMPVRVILNPLTALLGSARCAAIRADLIRAA
jgi:glucokinase